MVLALIICILLLIIFTGVLFMEINQKRKGSKLSLDANYYLADLPSLKIQEKLLSLLGGNRHSVKKIIDNIKQKYPGKTELWYWEKAIDDLEKDRR
ncbi:MAG: hypothetical protein ACFCU5_17845 [Pleurocapsa sp.]